MMINVNQDATSTLTRAGIGPGRAVALNRRPAGPISILPAPNAAGDFEGAHKGPESRDSLNGGDPDMTRVSMFNSPLFLGFDHLERMLDRASKAPADGYPPYNIEQVGDTRLRITLAVAGFGPEDLSVTVEDNQLVVRGKQDDSDEGRSYLHRGIAARQFQRSFVLAEGIEVAEASLDNGLLNIDLVRRVPEPREIGRAHV